MSCLHIVRKDRRAGGRKSILEEGCQSTFWEMLWKCDWIESLQVEINHLVRKKPFFNSKLIWLHCLLCILSNEGKCCKKTMVFSCLLEGNNLNWRDCQNKVRKRALGLTYLTEALAMVFLQVPGLFAGLQALGRIRRQRSVRKRMKWTTTNNPISSPVSQPTGS